MEEAGAGSAWAIKPGTAWAEEVEAEEAKHGTLVSETLFPSLGEAAKQPQAKQGKKGKGTKLSLSDFAASPFVASRRAQPSDQEILMQLPKGSSGLPKEERDSKALGGGFKDYGGNRQQGGFGDRGGRGDREEREPSRADSTADWGAERKFVPSDRPGGGGGGFGGGSFSRDRDGGFGGRSGGSGGFGDRPPREERPISEADTVDDWGANRKFTPSAGDSDRRGGGGAGGGGGGGFGGGGFRDRERPAGGGPPRFSDEPSRADTGDWGARRSTPDSDRPGPGGAGAAGGRDRRGYGFSDQPMSQADMEDKWSHRGPPPAEGGDKASAAPAERPRLKLAPRTLPLPEQPGQQQQQEQQQQANGAVASPRGSEAGSSGSGQQEKKAPKSNPFGAARPREEVLKEKGIDYQKEDLKLEHGEVLRDPTPEETEMEGEVEALRKQLEELQTTSPDETDTISDVKKELDEKERALYTLQAKLDDEVRYSKHKPERDGPTRGASSSSAAPPEDLSGFEPVRSTRRERPAAAAAAGGDAAAAGSSGQQQQQQEGGGGAPAAAGGAGGSGGGAWGRGGGRGGGGGGFGSFSRDRDGRDGGGRGGGRDGGRDGGPPRERRQNESLAGRAGGGW